MCTGACARVVALPLYVLALLSIICNVVLFFPDLDGKYAAEDRAGEARITEEVKYMGGVVGGGIMVLIPAIHIHLTSSGKCCANRCGMFLSVGFAAAGVAGAVYSLSAALLGLVNGPMCFWKNEQNPSGEWGVPFANSSGSYLTEKETWNRCIVPEGVVEFNVGLFSTLAAAASLELVLCLVQMVNGLFGCICGTCSGKE
ncbi:transmembrane 4 L6 family member 1-like [Syngnathoides biaculeatus]|uniref:transmembrane 4 L6 family member 1-like n=1 Tax=Syngnathoides biaculeatus TaxID=300417 RepID=UPI002ADE4D77|nr:transmembrane 4 L6 family member 1-like [Syngnathoides biaculeatus]